MSIAIQRRQKIQNKLGTDLLKKFKATLFIWSQVTQAKAALYNFVLSSKICFSLIVLESFTFFEQKVGQSTARERVCHKCWAKKRLQVTFSTLRMFEILSGLLSSGEFFLKPQKLQICDSDTFANRPDFGQFRAISGFRDAWHRGRACASNLSASGLYLDSIET